jgi:hypothetical protein
LNEPVSIGNFPRTVPLTGLMSHLLLSIFLLYALSTFSVVSLSDLRHLGLPGAENKTDELTQLKIQNIAIFVLSMTDNDGLLLRDR